MSTRSCFVDGLTLGLPIANISNHINIAEQALKYINILHQLSN